MRPNATWIATNGRMTPVRVPDRPPPVLRAVIGATLDARSAGASPNNAVVNSGQAARRPRTTRQSRRRFELNRIAGRREHADDGRRRDGGKEQPEQARRAATSALSTSTCWIKRPRPAPIDRRSAISCSRAAVRARNRFATFEPAMSSTSAAIDARIHSGRSNSRRNGDGPFAADRANSGVFRKRAISSGDRFGPAAPCATLAAEAPERRLHHALRLLDPDVGVDPSEHAGPAEVEVPERPRVVHRVRETTRPSDGPARRP